jgi:hypothetical protein
VRFTYIDDLSVARMRLPMRAATAVVVPLPTKQSLTTSPRQEKSCISRFGSS